MTDDGLPSVPPHFVRLAKSRTSSIPAWDVETTTGRPSSSATTTAVTALECRVKHLAFRRRPINLVTCTVRSAAPETTTGRPSSSATATAHPVGVAGERVPDRGAGGQVPHPHRAVVGAGDHDRAAVQLGHRHRPHPVGVAGERVPPGRRWPGPTPAPSVFGAGDHDRAAVQLGHRHRPTPPVWPVNG